MSDYILSENIIAIPSTTDRELGLYYTRDFNYANPSDDANLSDEAKSIILYNNALTKDQYDALCELDADAADYYVAPSSETGSFYNGRFLTEQNLTQLTRSSTDIPSYVITRNPLPSENPTLEFVLHGRYFKISDAALLTKQFLAVTATYTHSAAGDDPYATLNGIDIVVNNDAYFNGVRAYTADNADSWEALFADGEDLHPDTLALENKIMLVLIKEGLIPVNSQYKLDSYSVKNIYGGTI